MLDAVKPWIGIFVLLLAIPATASAKDFHLTKLLLEIEAREKAHDASDQTARAFGQNLERYYEAEVAPEITSRNLRKLSDKESAGVFEAIWKIGFYSEEPAAAVGLATVFKDLQRRGKTTPEQAKDLYGALRVAHQFPVIADLFKDRAKFPIPLISTAPSSGTSSRVYDVGTDGRSIAVKSLALPKGPAIVMLTRPTCGYSNRATQAIEADPVLKDAFDHRALFLNAPSLFLDVPQIAEWNRAHPAWKNYIVYSIDDWPGLNLGETPVFYFYRDGRLLSEVTGWPSDERKKDLMAGLAKIGLGQAKK